MQLCYSQSQGPPDRSQLRRVDEGLLHGREGDVGLRSSSPLCEALMQPLIAAAGTMMDAATAPTAYNWVTQ
jgi:hypothetical protein